MRNPCIMENFMAETRWLFFVEREFHIGLYKRLIDHIHENGLGEVGIYSFAWQPSKSGHRGRGARLEMIQAALDTPFTVVQNPYMFDPHYTFLADSSYEWVEGCGKLINIGHGTICKGSFYTRKPVSRRENAADLICVPGAIHRNELFHQVYRPIAVTGMPKLDPLFDGSLERDALLRGWSLDPSFKTILFAPTFNHEYSLIPHLEMELEQYFPQNFNLLIKLHAITPEEWREPFIQYAQKHPRAIFLDDSDITPALSAADVLISDISSVIYEFAATGKPVLLFDGPYRMEKHDPNDLENRFRDVGLRFTDPHDLPVLLEKPELPTSLEIAKKFISVTDGSATSRVFQAIAQLPDQKQATIVIGNAHPDEMEFYIKRYANRFALIFTAAYYPSLPTFDDQDIKALIVPDFRDDRDPWRQVHTALPHVRTEHVIYLDSSWNASSLLPIMLIGQMLTNPDFGMFVPMVSNQIDAPEQRIGHYFPQTLRLPDERINGPLTYYSPGECRPIENPLQHCFIAKINSLHDNRQAIALDCFIWPKQRF